MKRVLVTGATGFIGRHALAPLLERGFEVHACYSKAPIDADERVIWHKADLLIADAAEKLCAEIKPTHLLHFAWYVSPEDYKTSSKNELWKNATIGLIRAFGENGGKRAVAAGTCMEYDWSAHKKLKEDAPLSNETIYGKAKNETRALCERLACKSDISFAWGRVFNLYGPYETPRRLVPEVIRSLRAGKKPHIAQGVTLDYSYVKDISDAFAALLDSDVKGAVNVASGNALLLTEMARAIAEIMGKTDSIDAKESSSPADQEQYVVADTTRLTKEVGWHPHYSLRQGLEETIFWWQKSGFPE